MARQLQQAYASLSKFRHHTQDTQDSVGLLWTSDRPDAETSTFQHTTLTKDTRPAAGEIRTRRQQTQTHTLERVSTGIACFLSN